ncbi:MAG: hypothetical protein L3K01_01725 [Thermoplasmata archaeon]|nr:hypothetical protein [Thermoplasmata archaeon]
MGFRGIALGEALMRAGFGCSDAVRIRKVSLGVFVTNEAAIARYRKFGIVEEGSLRAEVILDRKIVDELRMGRRLRD